MNSSPSLPSLPSVKSDPHRRFQTLSRSDTDTLGCGVCPACNHTRFLLGGLRHHERGCFRRLLCIHCLREFGVAPTTLLPTGKYDDTPCAVILHYVLPDRRLASDYQIHTGAMPIGPLPPAGLVADEVTRL